MYSTCLFCSGALGNNEVIEHFSVGRRLAFDGAKGRLWVVCRRCERWNLTPLEERWEAIEECERAFRATRLRASTAQIGLARVKEGLELVRIGAPQRPEMAAWRYGDQFGRRMRRNVLWSVAGAAGGVGMVWAAPALWGWSVLAPFTALAAAQLQFRRRPVVRVRIGEGERVRVLKLAALHVHRSRLLSDGDGWQLELSHISPNERVTYTPHGLRHLTASVRLAGDDARRAVGRILPHLNKIAGRASTVQDAVRVLESGSSVDQCFSRAARLEPTARWLVAPMQGSIAALPVAVRLALEMAAHEETERRALDGELALLENAWREAEEIAGIADDLLLPSAIKEFVRQHRPER